MTTSPRLTLRERRVLLALVERGYIEHKGMDAAGKHTLYEAVIGLRKKLDPTMRIITLHGVGYRLEGYQLEREA